VKAERPQGSEDEPKIEIEKKDLFFENTKKAKVKI